MTEEKIHKLANAVKGRIYPHYSGRGMFGETCMGVVCSNIVGCLLVAGKLGLKNPKTDNLGLDYIVYFPDIKAKKKEVSE